MFNAKYLQRRVGAEEFRNSDKFIAQVDPNSPVPLYMQIRESIRKWIDSRQEGDRMPSENDIAAQAGVDRSTVRKALHEFVREGRLRRSTCGTVVAKSGWQIMPPHPLAFSQMLTDCQDETKITSIAVYEHLPAQKRLWSELEKIDNRDPISNAGNPRFRVLWVPTNIDTPELYSRFISSEQPDLVLLPHQLVASFVSAGNLHPLPPHLTDRLRSSDYHDEIIPRELEDILEWVVPVHFSVYGVIWNLKLLGESARNIPSLLTQRDFIDRLLALKPKGSQKKELIANPWDLACMRGIPFPEKDIADTDLAQWFEPIAKLRPYKECLRWQEDRIWASCATFLRGDAITYAGNLSYILNYLPQASFPWHISLFAAETGLRLPANASCAAIRRSASDTAALDAAISFLAQEHFQKQVAVHHVNFAFSRQSNGAWHILVNGDDHRGSQISDGGDDAVNCSIRSFALFTTAQERWCPFLINTYRPLFQALVEGTMELSEVVKVARELARTRSASAKNHEMRKSL